MGGFVVQNWSYSGVMLFAAILSTCGLVVAISKTKMPSEPENAPQSALLDGKPAKENTEYVSMLNIPTLIQPTLLSDGWHYPYIDYHDSI